ncbi:MAG: peptidase [Deltaproteobacteria bacterium]|nr:peptidase [Deltaproteobacteria bacterium]
MSRSQCFVAVVLLALIVPDLVAQAKITTPKEALGEEIGADYFLADYQQLEAYWKTLEKQSDRMTLEVIGKTEEGRDMLMAIVTSPKNHARLERYKEISRRLTLAEGIDEAMAKELAAEGKSVVWIDGGLHASEVLVAQQLIQMVYLMVSRNDEETLRILDDVVILFANPNPDGQDLVAQWYMRKKDPKKRSSRGLPRLYQKYTGHDNNRDFYMATQKESEALCRVFYHQWFPQIIFNHHQTGPSGTVLFAPPFRGPHNYNIDPLVILGIDLVGASMHTRFAVEGKPGSTCRSGASYSTWWNGGLRTAVYYHNMIGLLTETIGSPTPMEIPLRLQRLLSTADSPNPITPQKWHFKQSVDYSITANYAVLDVASRHRSQFLFNAWRMGMNSIERGGRDHWTIRPDMIARAEKAQAEEQGRRAQRGRRGRGRGNEGGSGGEAGGESGEGAERKRRDVWTEVFRDPAHRDPRGYILPADQRDFLTATKFVNTLIKQGIAIHRATAAFEVAGTRYPKGSYVVKSAQAFRPHLIDMFEPQDHPDDVQYPGGPPKAPYDAAGWTLAYQMGVEFDRVLDGFDGPFEKIKGFASCPKGAVTRTPVARGFVLGFDTIDASIAVNRLLADGVHLSWLKQGVTLDGQLRPAGTVWIDQGKGVDTELKRLAEELGLTFTGSTDVPPVAARMPLRKARVGLWDRYGGSMPSGWVRWILERASFDFRRVFPKELDAGGLAEKFDAIIFVSGGIPAPRGGSAGGGRRGGRRGRGGASDPKDIPQEYREHVGRVTAAKTIPQLKAFMEAGGAVLTIGSSTALARHLELPITSALVEPDENGNPTALPRSKFFVPGSILRTRIDREQPLAWGMPDHLDVLFRRSPVFRLRPQAHSAGIRAVGWFDTDTPLRSGWAFGEHYLKDGVTLIDAPVGKGSLFLFGPEITYRAQPHASFKLLFNGVHLGAARRGEN